MIIRVYSILAYIATRYGRAKGRFVSVFAEQSKYEIYKKAYNFHKNGGSDFEIPKSTFYEMRKKRLIVDGTKGGLLIGNSHEKGGILIVREYVDKVLLVAEIEGYEYLLNSKSSEQYLEEIQGLNAINERLVSVLPFTPYHVPKSVRTIDVRSRYVDGKMERPLLLVRGKIQWCVNKISSRDFLGRLDEINKLTE